MTYRDPELDEFLDNLVRRIRRWLVLGEAELILVALWVVYAVTLAAHEIRPVLAIRSAEKASGKTRLLEILALLFGERCDTTSLITASNLFRTASDGGRIILADESDAWLSSSNPSEGSEAMRAIINASHRPRLFGYVRQTDTSGKTPKSVKYKIDCAIAIAGLKALPETVADRSIPIVLIKRKATEPIERFRFLQAEQEIAPLRERLDAMAPRLTELLVGAMPALPEALEDRQMDNLSPLAAVADLAGGAWPGLARSAFLSLSREVTALVGSGSIGVELLRAVREVFVEADDPAAVSSLDLLRGLYERSEGPWAARYGCPDLPSERQRGAQRLAADLGAFGVRPKTVRLPDGSTPRGYSRADLADPWSRHAPDVAPVPTSAPDVAPLFGIDGGLA